VLGVGSMVGAGIFALLGEAGAVAGAAVWISFLIGGIVAGLLGYVCAKLGMRFPSSGGLITYLTEGFGLGRVVVLERRVAVGVGRVQAVKLGEDDRLDDGEALVGAILEVPLGLLAVETVEELPRGVGEVEERLAICGHEEMSVVRNLQPRWCGPDKLNAQGKENEGNQACGRFIHGPG